MTRYPKTTAIYMYQRFPYLKKKIQKKPKWNRSSGLLDLSETDYILILKAQKIAADDTLCFLLLSLEENKA